VYLVADEIGRHNRWDQAAGEVIPLLSWREIKQLQAEGVSFGSHSATHRSLSSLRLQEVVRELRRSTAVLEQGLGTAVRSFAYPYGAFNWVIQ
jgi:peptidoglycan/xylan/chitin deacetylase (PgdA/CDA1 family)